MPSLTKNIIYSSVLTCGNYIFPLLVYPYVSRVLGVENIGLCGFIDGIIDYFILFSMLGITVFGVREIAACQDSRHKRSETLSSILTLNAVMTLLSLITLVLCTVFIDKLHENWTFMTVGAFKLIFNLFLIEWFYKGIEDFKFITLRTLLVRCVYVAAVFLFVREPGDTLIYYTATVLTVVINAVINLIYSRKFATVSLSLVSFDSVKQFVGPMFILGLYMLLTSAYTTFNVIFLGFECDDYQVGLYTTASKFYGILIGLYTSFTTVMMPRMSSLLSQGKIEEFRKHVFMSMDALLMFCIPVITFVLIYASEVIRLLSGPGYDGATTPTRIIIPLMFVIGLAQILVVQCLMPLKADRSVLFFSGMGALVSVVLNFTLVKKFGAVGTSIVWLGSETVVTLLAMIVVRKRTGIGFPAVNVVRQVLCYVPLGVMLYFINEQMPDYIASLAVGTGGALVYFLGINTVVLRNSLFKQCVSRLFNRAKV